MNNNHKIKSAIYFKPELSKKLMELIHDLYGFGLIRVEDKLNEFIEKLKDDLYFFIEYPYVDKFYRNTYYHYFSTKHRHYPKDCIRVSIFSESIEFLDFRSFDNKEKLEKSFLGYFIIRPTLPNFIGRSFISPTALLSNNFCTCLVKIEVLVNGTKLSTFGFPYSTQDTETITCAETTIWIMMEYFGNKYADYKPVLPSSIISFLSKYSYERQLPSNGLTAQQISFALREFDFGVRIYHSKQYPNKFKSIFYSYIDSGIPFIATLQNEYIGHAIAIFGQKEISESEIDNIPESDIVKLSNGLRIVDSSKINRPYIVMDDNVPPYQHGNFDDPGSYYLDPSFKGATITSIIVPLYSKIYLEAYEARELALLLCDSEIFENKLTEDTILRLYLTSSRSFKFHIAMDNELDNSSKNQIIESPMPKFIWLAELSTKQQFKEKKAFGIIALDATEANDELLESLLFIAFDDKFIKFEAEEIKYWSILFKSFNSFNNLQGVKP